MDYRLWFAPLLLISLANCQSPDSTETFAARVGSAYLFDTDMEASLSHLSSDLDKTKARRQLIEQWINQELLYQEALKRGLPVREDIKERLDQSAREVLIEGIIFDYQNQTDMEVTPVEIATYYEKNREYLHFLGSFVKVRHLSSPHQDSLELALKILQQRPVTDSLFALLIERFSSSATRELEMLRNYFPETALFQDEPILRQYIQTTQAGGLPELLTVDSTYHLIQIVNRSLPDTTPELPWVQDFIREQLMIQNRNRIYVQSVHSLRAQAEFREDIEIR